jgi:hypothetical protein
MNFRFTQQPGWETPLEKNIKTTKKDVGFVLRFNGGDKGKEYSTGNGPEVWAKRCHLETQHGWL